MESIPAACIPVDFSGGVTSWRQLCPGEASTLSGICVADSDGLSSMVA